MPIHRASHNDNVELIKFLIDNGANVEAKTHEGNFLNYFSLILKLLIFDLIFSKKDGVQYIVLLIGAI